jgi:hypothetical protein
MKDSKNKIELSKKLKKQITQKLNKLSQIGKEMFLEDLEQFIKKY